MVQIGLAEIFRNESSFCTNFFFKKKTNYCLLRKNARINPLPEFVKVSQVTIFYSSLDTFIKTNTSTPKGGAPIHRRNMHPRKKERKKN